MKSRSTAGASPDSQSDFGSFTGHDNHSGQWSFSPPVESAEDYITAAQQQAPHLLSGVSAAFSRDQSNTGPATGVSTASTAETGSAQLQHMDTSAPISLGLFGEESYEDPALDLPGQGTFQRPESSAGAAPDSPVRGNTAIPQQHGASLQLPQEPQHTFQSGSLPVGHANPDVHTSSSWLPDEADESDFSPTWQEAAPSSPSQNWADDHTTANGPETLGQPNDRPITAAPVLPSGHSETAFAATWPQPSTGGYAHSPQRQVMSGPIPLELFDMEETSDPALDFPLQAVSSVIPTVSSSEQLHLAAQSAASAPSSPSASTSLQRSLRTGSQTDLATGGHQAYPEGNFFAEPIAVETFFAEAVADQSLDEPIQAVQAAVTVLPVDPRPSTGKTPEIYSCQLWTAGMLCVTCACL